MEIWLRSMKTNKRFQFNAPPRPDLEALLEESARRVVAMTPEEREEMIRQQIRNVAPYPDKSTYQRDAVPMSPPKDDLKERLDAWTDKLRQAKAEFSKHERERAERKNEEFRQLKEFFDTVKVRAVQPPKFRWKNFADAFPAANSPFHDEEIKQQLEHDDDEDREFWDDMVRSFNKFDPCALPGCESHSPDAGTKPSTCGTPPKGFIDNEWFRNFPKDRAGIVHPRERIVPRYDEPVAPLSEKNKVSLDGEREIKIIVKVVDRHYPFTFTVNSSPVAREQADAIVTNGFCHCAGDDLVFYPTHRIEWVQIVGMDKNNSWYPKNGAIIP